MPPDSGAHGSGGAGEAKGEHFAAGVPPRTARSSGTPHASACVAYREAVSSRASSPAANVMTVDAVGVRIGIDLTALDPPERRAVRSAWRSAVSPSSAQPDRAVVPQRFAETGEMLARLSGAVTHAAITAPRHDRWMLHAAGLAGPDGGVVVLIGRSGAGKTTATRFLARRWGYVSDETIGIDADGAVHAYRKPLSVITDGVGFKVQRAPEDLGLQPLPGASLHLSRLVLLDRQPGPSAAALVSVPDVEALAELTRHSSALTTTVRPVQTIVQLLAKTGGAVRAQYSEARDLVPLLDDLTAAHAAVGGTARPEPGWSGNAPPLDDGDVTPASGTRFRRVPVVDWCRLDDGLLAVLTAETSGEGTVRVLAGVAPEIWLAAEYTLFEDLVDAVTRRHRAPDATAATRAALDALVAAGLVTGTA